MTREEAIKELKDFKDKSWDGMPEEVIDIAIKALEQEPISEVLDSIKGEIASLNINTINAGDFTRTMAELYSFKKVVLAIIDSHIRRSK